jgi:hypothetical protein
LTALAMQIPGLSATQILDKFIRGLKPKTRIEMELRDPQTADEVYRLADCFERIVYGAKATSFLMQNYNCYAPTSDSATSGYGEPMQIDTFRPRRSGQTKDQQRLRLQGLCFNCKKPGHIAAYCPKNPVEYGSSQGRKPQSGKARRQ